MNPETSLPFSELWRPYNMSSYTITNVSLTESRLRNRKCLFWLFSQSVSSFHQFYSEHCFMFYVPVCNFALPCFIIPPRPPIVKVLKQEVKPLCWSDHETTVLQTVNLKRGKEIGRKYEENHHLIIILIITFRRKIKMASIHQNLNSLKNVYLFICLKVFLDISSSLWLRGTSS